MTDELHHMQIEYRGMQGGLVHGLKISLECSCGWTMRSQEVSWDLRDLVNTANSHLTVATSP